MKWNVDEIVYGLWWLLWVGGAVVCSLIVVGYLILYWIGQLFGAELVPPLQM